MIHEDIKNGIKSAMLAKNTVLLETLRMMSAAMMNESVAKGRKPNEILSDEEALAVITRLAKQRKDSIDQYRKGGREDLVAEEESQLKILETYLPKMMDRSEVEKIVKTKKAELGINDASQKGMLMKAIMPELKGKADGAVVKEVVDSIF
ncbi:MAG: GatB/YqeY domain-containing protein [Patescibacteria group bacterium]